MSWSSKHQATVALSSTESEYVELARTCQQVTWLRSFMQEVSLGQEDATEMFGDNSGSNHYIREKVEQKEVVVREVRSEENVADGLTKALGPTLHMEFVQQLRLQHTEQGEC